MRYIFKFFLISSLFFIFCIFVFPGHSMGQQFCGTSSQEQCSNATDCIAGGCFMSTCKLKNQINSAMPSIEDCDWDTCYDHRAFGLECGCFENQCQWENKNVNMTVKTTGENGSVLSGVLVGISSLGSPEPNLSCYTNQFGECSVELLATHQYKITAQKDGYNCLIQQCSQTIEAQDIDFSIFLLLDRQEPDIKKIPAIDGYIDVTINDPNDKAIEIPEIPKIPEPPQTLKVPEISKIPKTPKIPETSSRGVSISYIHAEITRIISLIEQLQVQLSILQSNGDRINDASKKLTKNLSYGAKGSQVKLLQSWLSQDKVLYPSGLITGYFGKLTQAAVKRFQYTYAIEVLFPRGINRADGQVELLTRQKLNELFAK